MHLDVKLQGPYNYSTWPIYLLLALLVLSIVFLIIYFKFLRNKIKDKKIKIKKPPLSKVEEIKNKYLLAIDKIEIDIKLKNIGNRKAYRELSSAIRLFVYEMTGLRVQNYTLTEISTLNIHPLTQLVAEYYSPEFKMAENGNVMESISKTKGVIQSWR